MAENIKYLYHYTKFDSGIKILESQSLRMYNALSQSDPYDIVYGAQEAFKMSRRK